MSRIPSLTTFPMNSVAQRPLPAADALVILGSGMSDCVPESDLLVLEHFGATVEGHGGVLGLLRHGERDVLVSIGRRHLYEGLGLNEVTSIVDRAAEAGVRRLVLTNAAGGLDPLLGVGDVMAITSVSHLLLGARLWSPEPPRSSPTSSTGGLDPVARRRTLELARDRGVALQEGVYAAVSGPSYETRAEIRLLRRLGAHAVGMSTAPELHAARRLGLRAVALSLITNQLSDAAAATLDHAHVVEAGQRGAARMRVAIDCALDALLI